MTTTTTKTTKEEVKAVFHKVFQLQDDWMPTDDDMALVHKIFDAEGATTTQDRIKVVDEFMRIDSKTLRTIIEGFLIFGCTAYFAKEKDAVEYLNANGVECTDFNSAYEMSERGEIDDTYFTEWYDHETFVWTHEYYE